MTIHATRSFEPFEVNRFTTNTYIGAFSVMPKEVKRYIKSQNYAPHLVYSFRLNPDKKSGFFEILCKLDSLNSEHKRFTCVEHVNIREEHLQRLKAENKWISTTVTPSGKTITYSR